MRLLSTRLSARLAEHLAFVPGEHDRARELSADAVASAEELGEPTR